MEIFLKALKDFAPLNTHALTHMYVRCMLTNLKPLLTTSRFLSSSSVTLTHSQLASHTYVHTLLVLTVH